MRCVPRGTPVLATTATANDRVVQDVSKQLGDVRLQRGCLMLFLANALDDPYAETCGKCASCLGYPVVGKIRQNEPQKHQQNRYHQCSNLDGVFAVIEEVRTGPVLLLDDVVDSGWTLAVIAALLREAGCSAVYPAALASSAPGN